MTSARHTILQEGHIFKTGKVVDLDSYGRWVVEVASGDQKFNVCLEPGFIPDDAQIEKGSTLSRLVLIDAAAPAPKVALAGYLSVLKEIYYENCRPRMDLWQHWYGRWDDECTEGFSEGFKTCATRERMGKTFKLYELRGHDYILPISVMTFMDHLQPPESFFPDVAYWNDKTDNYSVSSALSRSDEVPHFPFCYSAKAASHDNKKQFDVLIYLHSFTIPFKWHYSIWKHVLGLSPSANNTEDGVLWDDLSQSCNTGICASVFSECRENQKNGKGTSCDPHHCRTNKLFPKVHEQIKPVCRKYLEDLVTFFESCPTNQLTVCFPVGGRQDVEVVFCGEDSKKVHRKSVLRGICYRYQSRRPVLHLTPITFYKAKKTLPCTSEMKLIPFQGYLSDIQRLS